MFCEIQGGTNISDTKTMGLEIHRRCACRVSSFLHPALMQSDDEGAGDLVEVDQCKCKQTKQPREGFSRSLSSFPARSHPDFRHAVFHRDNAVSLNDCATYN